MTTAILSALAQEQGSLAQSLADARRVECAGRVFLSGQLQGVPVVLALSGIGKVAAATTASVLAERFGVQRMVFTGVAGGVGAGVAVGDAVVASGYVQHDFDASPIFPRWHLPGYDGARLDCDAALSGLLLQAARACVVEVDGLPGTARAAQAHHGLMASGDQFVSTSAASGVLRQDLLAAGHDVLAVEMEGAAVAQVCHDYGLPFAAVRTISDRADDSAHVDFPFFIEHVASRYADFMLREFLRLWSLTSASRAS